MRVWWNWQTRKIQVLVGATLYRFKSCYSHQEKALDVLSGAFFNVVCTCDVAGKHHITATMMFHKETIPKRLLLFAKNIKINISEEDALWIS